MFPRTAVLIPCYKRQEYTAHCLKAIEEAQEYINVDFYLIDDGSNDETFSILTRSNLKQIVLSRKDNIGLRNTIIEFFDMVKLHDYKYLVKMDNDCEVPKYWLSDLINILETTDADVISPNVVPSNAAFKNGQDDIDGKGYRPSLFVGGLWCMKAELPKGIYFEKTGPNGIRGAFNILKQIIMEKEPIVGWTDKVTIQDIGHWSGTHPKHIKSEDHAIYSAEVGRGVSW